MEENKAPGENKILIIDDDDSVRSFLEMFLKKKGYIQVLLASTGEAGLKLLAEEDKVRIILLDIMLPDINGLELLRKIKKIIKRDIGVIMITGYPDEDKAKEAISEGAYDYIIKPFDLAYLELSLLTKIVKMV
ncbi:MAG: response regulator [Candidatus Omnitrophota bacterium]|nr:response regulator [Candidatus Omnitrophota bacterium]MBU1928285.1 response regulator [Candidatus Omnitrophota bacterium]MBU2035559.1 response regulator [Candidatus Omnitrophota bacterium]MBU2257662.1 response regulator [Candidatus Omnitrophota bacterium]